MKERIWLGLGIAFVILTFSSILFPALTSAVEAGWFQSGNPGLTNGGDQTTAYGNATRVAILAPSSDITATGTITNYFPFVGKAPTPTPTNTPTPTPIPNPIVNGGFEQGSFKWYGGLAIPYDANPQGWDLTTQRNQLPSPVTPHSGDWVAWMGGYQNSRTNLQTADPFLVPAGGSTLRYWYWIQSDESNCDAINTDGAWVYFSDNQNNYAVDSYALCTVSRSSGWLKRDIDLSPYVGKSGWLSFIERNVGQNSNWFIDDVQLGTLASGQFKPVTR